MITIARNLLKGDVLEVGGVAFEIENVLRDGKQITVYGCIISVHSNQKTPFLETISITIHEDTLVEVEKS